MRRPAHRTARLARTAAAVLAAGLFAPAVVPATAGAAGGVVTEVRYVPTSAQDGAVVRVEIKRDTAHDADGQPVLLAYSATNAALAPTGMAIERRADVTEWIDDGIAGATADVLGMRGSTGCWDVGGADEQQAGVDVVNFLAGRTPDVDGNPLSWSSGRVGMTGTGYDGTTATMVAAAGDRAPDLVAVAPIGALSRWYAAAYENGVRRITVQRQLPKDPRYPPPIPEGGPLADGILGATTVHPDLDPATARPAGCTAVADVLAATSDRTPDHDAWWDERDHARATAEQWSAATLIAHKWQDPIVPAAEALRLHDHLASLDDPATPEVEGPRDLRLWVTRVGGSLRPLYDYMGWGFDEMLADFWAAHLLDDAAARDRLDDEHDRVQSWSRWGDGWVLPRTPAWPPPGTATHSFHVNRTYEQDIDGVTVPGPGTGEVGELDYVNRWEGPTAGRGGDYGLNAGWLDTGLATEELSRNDPWSNEGNPGPLPGGQGYYSLAFSTGTLDQSVRIAGRPVLEGYFQIGFGAGVPGATLTPLLVEISPDGSMTTLARGFMNVDYRDGIAGPPTPATGLVRVDIPFLPTDATVMPGNRIGLVLQSSNALRAVPGTPAGFNAVLFGPWDGLTDAGSILHLPLVGATDPIFTDAAGR